jgi:hypothetical protein
MFFIDFIGVATHVGPVEERGTNFGFIKIRDIWLLIEQFSFLNRKHLQNFQ